jgi:Ca-activated chloride channel family protein
MNWIARGIAISLIAGIGAGSISVAAQEQPSNIVFRSTVDVVSVTAVVRDRRHRVVTSLTRADLQVIDAGEPQTILDFRTESSAPASVALLVDGSGSMRLGAAADAARKISGAILDSLDSTRDDAALLSFDRRLLTIHGFTHDFNRIRQSFDRLESFGLTSLYDAIAGTAGIIADKSQNRRAIVVLTDGIDTGSAYSPEQVSRIASSIDVPVYVFALGEVETDANGRAVGSLRDLAVETGGDVIVANTPRLVDAGIQRLVEELRHQYLISFRANSFDGLRRVQVRAMRKDLTVRARAWYFAGGDLQ